MNKSNKIVVDGLVLKKCWAVVNRCNTFRLPVPSASNSKRRNKSAILYVDRTSASEQTRARVWSQCFVSPTISFSFFSDKAAVAAHLPRCHFTANPVQCNPVELFTLVIYWDEKASYIYRYIQIIGSASIKKETILGVIGAGLAHVLLHLLETLVVRSSGCWSLKSTHAAL